MTDYIAIARAARARVVVCLELGSGEDVARARAYLARATVAALLKP